MPALGSTITSALKRGMRVNFALRPQYNIVRWRQVQIPFGYVVISVMYECMYKKS